MNIKKKKFINKIRGSILSSSLNIKISLKNLYISIFIRLSLNFQLQIIIFIDIHMY